MDGQLSFATLDYAGKKKRTKRDVFLAEMAAAVPWSVLEAVIAPHYPKEGPQGGRRAFPIAVMLRIYCLQQWYNLSDPGAEEALYDIQSMRASTIVPPRSNAPRASRYSATASNTVFVSSCASSRCRKFKIVVSSGIGSRPSSRLQSARIDWISYSASSAPGSDRLYHCCRQ